jgi:heme oxygenase
MEIPEAPPEQAIGLGDAINTATRSAHTKLNKLILLRLPLALPPQKLNSAAYVTGLLHVAPVYTVFEGLWQSILDAPVADDAPKSTSDGCEPGQPLLDAQSLILCPFTEEAVLVHQPLLCDRIRMALGHMHFASLQRSARLREDIRSLTGWPDQVVEERLRVTAQVGRLGEFIAHIKRSVERRPHVLLAYAWVLYMALFSGGRFIRASLEAAGEGFWSQLADPTRSSSRLSDTALTTLEDELDAENCAPPLRFFHFDAPADGEHLKKEFKLRLSETEPLLTTGERAAIVHEAGCIFDYMISIVGQLDEACNDGLDAAVVVSVNPLDEWAALLTRTPGITVGSRSRIRDSVLVTKEREVDRAEREQSVVAESQDGGDKELADPLVAHKGLAEPVQRAGALPTLGTQSPDDTSRTATASECCIPPLKTMHFEPALPLPHRIAKTLRMSSDCGDVSHESLARLPAQTGWAHSVWHVITAKNGLLLVAMTAFVAGYLYGR